MAVNKKRRRRRIEPIFMTYSFRQGEVIAIFITWKIASRRPEFHAAENIGHQTFAQIETLIAIL